MKFYNRENEIKILSKKLSSNGFEFIYLLGKRRVGKTTLIEETLLNHLKKDYLYVFIERSDYPIMLKKLENYIHEKTGLKYDFSTLDDFLDYFFKQKEFNILVIDEFQNFNFINKGLFSIFQKKIDQYHKTSNKKIVVLGSMQSMMVKIFENANEPLYKRSTFSLQLKSFDIITQNKILKDFFQTNYKHNILLDIYSIFGGIPYYFKSLEKVKEKNYNLKKLLSELFFSDFALLRNEGKEILIEEFGQKYKRFFAILEAVSKGKSKRHEIMSELQLGTGEIDIYLKELCDIYDILEVQYPIFEEKKNISNYAIKDNFLQFRFRYIYANKAKIELGLYNKIITDIIKDFSSYQGFKFEKFVKEYLIMKNKEGKGEFSFSAIGKRIDRNNNEIEIIYTDEKKNIVFLETKLNSKRINSSEQFQLQKNIELFLTKHPTYKNKIIKKGFAVFDEKNLVKFEWF